MIEVLADIRQTKSAAMDAAEHAHSGGEGVQDALGRLILASARKRSARPKNTTQWLYQARASDKLSEGRKLEYLHVIGGRAYGTDGYRGHWVRVGSATATGCYSWTLKGDIQQIDGVEPMAAMSRVYKEANRDDDYTEVDLSALPTRVNLTTKMITVKIGGTWFNDKYLQDAISLPGTVELAEVQNGILRGRILEDGYSEYRYFTIAGIYDK